MTLRYAEPQPFTEPAAGRCRSRTRLLFDYLLDAYALADDLGCYSDRPVTGGTKPSQHRDGVAFDIGFIQDEDARQDAADWLVENHEALGVQMVLNYRRSGSASSGWYWRLARYEDETEPERGTFTKAGHWLHVEVHPTIADDTTPIAALLDPEPVPPDPVPPEVGTVLRLFKFSQDEPELFASGDGVTAIHVDAPQWQHWVALGIADPDDIELLARAEAVRYTFVGQPPPNHAGIWGSSGRG